MLYFVFICTRFSFQTNNVQSQIVPQPTELPRIATLYGLGISAAGALKDHDYAKSISPTKPSMTQSTNAYTSTFGSSTSLPRKETSTATGQKKLSSTSGIKVLESILVKPATNASEFQGTAIPFGIKNNKNQLMAGEQTVSHIDSSKTQATNVINITSTPSFTVKDTAAQISKPTTSLPVTPNLNTDAYEWVPVSFAGKTVFALKKKNI